MKKGLGPRVKGSRAVSILSLSAVLASLLWPVPGFAGKTALSEDDMDGITANGESLVIQANSSGAPNTITVNDAMSANLRVGQGAQNNLKTLIVNTVVGDQLIANALNMGAMNQGTRGAISQTNLFDQSWGGMMLSVMQRQP